MATAPQLYAAASVPPGMVPSKISSPNMQTHASNAAAPAMVYAPATQASCPSCGAFLPYHAHGCVNYHCEECGAHEGHTDHCSHSVAKQYKATKQHVDWNQMQRRACCCFQWLSGGWCLARNGYCLYNCCMQQMRRRR